MGRTDSRAAKSDTGADECRIAVLAYPGAQRAAVHGLIDLLETASCLHRAQRPTRSRRKFVSLRVMELAPADCRGRRGAGLSAVILPPSLGGTINAQQAAPLLPWLRARHREGTRLCSVCAGAFLLAETGLLRGRRATTHWALAGEFAQRFPDVMLDIDRMLIDEGDLITGGGVMAWIDLGLRLIEQLLSRAVMQETARLFLVDPAGREQQHYAPHQPVTRHGDRAVLAAQHWLDQHYSTPVAMPTLAAAAGVGERTLLRRFKSATGDTPSAYLQGLRVARARERLEQSEESFEEIAWAMGYEDVGAFRRIFQRVMGLSPGEYRRRFKPGSSAA